MKRWRFRRAAWAVAAVVTLMLMVPVNGATSEETINYRLKWLYNASVVGDIYAASQGIFADAGLKVNVKEGGPERDAIKELELGHAQFGVASADQVIRALSKGSPVVVIAQLFQVNPLQWIYRDTLPEIRNLSALKGLTIGITYGGNDEHIMRTLLAKAGIGEKDVRLFSVRYDYTPFYQRRVDLWPVYRNTQGVIISDKLRRAGEGLRFFNPADYGVDFVANSVVTSARMLKKSPQLVARFLGALLEGWRQAMAEKNRARAIAVLQRFDPDTPVQILGRQLDMTRPLVRPTPTFAIGSIDVSAWEQTERIMLTQHQIERPVEVAKTLKTELARH